MLPVIIHLIFRITNNQPYFQWDFGSYKAGSPTHAPTGCNALGLAQFQINIPVSDVFYDPPIPAIPGYRPLLPVGISANTFTIDLYQIQQCVLMFQEKEP